MSESTALRKTEALASFFDRLISIESIIRIVVSQARLAASFTFRGEPSKKVLLDLSADPARVTLDGEARGGQISITIEGAIMHDILLGRVKPGLALGRRELLLRGSAMDLSKFIPLFDFGPVLYREHLADAGYGRFARRQASALPKETPMSGQTSKGGPVRLVELSGFEKAFFKAVNGIAYGVGYLVGLLRYRVFEKMSLFEVLGAMSRGLDAASPKELREGRGQGSE
ncbi:MAG: hypothetical protein AB1640_11590 [bacterium]